MERYIGGEFWYDDFILKAETWSPDGKNYFLSGGKASIRIICEYLSEHGIVRMLLPSYLCLLIVSDIQDYDIECIYYNIPAGSLESIRV